MAGEDVHKTEYIWLCASCAQVMHPKVEVSNNTVRVRLTKNEPTLAADIKASLDAGALKTANLIDIHSFRKRGRPAGVARTP
jgi:hypothetical protein